MIKLEYIRSGDYFIPNLTLSEQTQTPIGKYGRMRKTYLQEHRPALYSHLLLSEKLYHHLLDVNRAANERLELLMPPMIKAAGITERLKSTDQMRWVGLMNAVRNQSDSVECFVSLQGGGLSRSWFLCRLTTTQKMAKQAALAL